MGNRPKNPYGVWDNQVPSTGTKISHFYHVAGDIPNGRPTNAQFGANVAEWSSLHVFFYADELTHTQVSLRVVPWRYYPTAPEGRIAAETDGRWVAGPEIEVALDPALITATRAQHYTWDTREALRMYWQIVEVVDHTGGVGKPNWLVIQPHGYTKQSDPKVTSVSAGAHGGVPPVPTIDVNKDVLADGLAQYNTARTIWSATYASSTTILLSDGGTNYPAITSKDIVAIGVRRSGYDDLNMYYRGTNLDVTYAPGTGIITLGGGLTIGAADTLEVWWDFASRSISTHDATPTTLGGDETFVSQTGAVARNVLPTAVDNGDAVQVIADLYGRLMTANFQLTSQANRVEEINPLNDKYITEILLNSDIVNDDSLDGYYPSSSGGVMDGWKDLTLDIYLVGGVGTGPVNRTVDVTFEVSSDIDPVGTPRWTDITLAGYVSSSDQTVRQLGWTTIGSTGTTATKVVVAWDDLNVKKWRVKVDWDGDPDATPGAISIFVRRKAL